MKYFFSIFTIFVVIALDQLSKGYILLNIPDYYIINDFFNVVQIWNRGISFGLFSGENSNTIFIVITIGIVGFMSYLLIKAKDKIIMATYSLIIGGAIGNIIDRFHYKAVFDFIDLHIGNVHWPAFNIADSAISIGGIILAWNIFFKQKTLIPKS